jgi:hypothetical protein
MRLADVHVPATATVRCADQVLRRFSPPALVHHCHRSYLFAAALAVQDRLEIDWELLHVAALLHDLALEPAFDNHILPFEEAGGWLAWVFAAGAGWPDERRDHAAAVIVAHMVGTDPAVNPEGHLLDVATGLDISGRDRQRWPEPFLAEVLDRFPRLDLAEHFLACFRDQAARKPGSAAAAALRGGLAERMANNPLASPG